MTIITCKKHGEQEGHLIGDKEYCPKCVQVVFDDRVAGLIEPEE